MCGASNANLNPLGWNPCQKILPKSRKKLGSYHAVLKRHRAYLARLAEQKAIVAEEKEAERLFNEEKEAKFRDNANKQRRKIAQMKANQEDLFAPAQEEAIEKVEATPVEAPEKSEKQS